METKETVASRCWIENRRVWLELADQRQISFPVSKYPLLANAPDSLLKKVSLRLNGLALRWEELDEDIWVDDAVTEIFHKRANWRRKFGNAFLMATFSNKVPENENGRYYVDRSCIYCELCVLTAPKNFKEINEMGWAAVFKQPENPEEEKVCREAKEGCPTESIGDNGF